MAKGSAMGLWRGKKGSSVFYYLRNSNNREKQGIREYQPVVSNPQTTAQMDQRVYMKPAQNLYRQLADIIRRSWQGLEYGGKGTQEFFKYALRQGKFTPQGQIPWLDKGDNRAVPGAYQISNGSIREVLVTQIDNAGFVTSLYIGDAPGSTWGEYSEKLIANNDIKQGDQLTIVTCLSDKSTANDQASAAYIWNVASAYVNTDDDTPIGDVIPLPVVITQSAGYLSGDVSGGELPQYLAGVAIIVSRLGSTGTYQRSPAIICVNGTIMSYWFSFAKYAAAKLSYTIFGGSRSGNWIVDDNAGDNPATREKVDGTFTLAGLTGDKASANGTSVRVQRYADDNSIAAVYVIPTEVEGETVYPLINSANGRAVQYTGTGGAFGYIFPSDQAELTGKSIIIVG